MPWSLVFFVGVRSEEIEEDLVLVSFFHKVIDIFKVFEFIEANDERYRDDREVALSPPKLINKSAVVFCTYSGPHCGVNEALPVGKYIRQFLEHLGFDVKDEWYEVGEFHGWSDASTQGKLGDIRGRPNDDDLMLVELKAAQLARSL